jgi:hypothetical protein
MNIGDDFSVDQLKTLNAELDLTCAGARELALALLSEADRADLVGRVGLVLQSAHSTDGATRPGSRARRG